MWTGTIKNEGNSTYLFINYTSTANDNEDDFLNADKFSFEIRRYKNKETYKENLVISVYELNNNNNILIAKATTDFVNIESTLLDLRNYGLIIERKNFAKIRKIIERRYIEISANTIVADIDIAVCNLYISIVKDIKSKNINKSDHKNYVSYDISAGDFSKYLMRADYIIYSATDIRKCLSKMTFGQIKEHLIKSDVSINIDDNQLITKCNSNRYDNTINNTKVISLIASCVDIVHEYIKNNEK